MRTLSSSNITFVSLVDVSCWFGTVHVNYNCDGCCLARKLPCRASLHAALLELDDGTVWLIVCLVAYIALLTVAYMDGVHMPKWYSSRVFPRMLWR